MDTKHTPGPWRVYTDGGGREEADTCGTHVMAGPTENEETYIVCEQIDNEADARLIAQAPAMLAFAALVERKIREKMPERHDDLTAVSVTFTGGDLAEIRATITAATNA